MAIRRTAVTATLGAAVLLIVTSGGGCDGGKPGYGPCVCGGG